MTNTPINLAPDGMTSDDITYLMSPYLALAEGLGVICAREQAKPEYAENPPGWDQATFFDHPAGEIIMGAACDDAKAFAKNARLFYNNAKLEDYISQSLVVAYGDAFKAEAKTLDLETQPAPASVPVSR